MTEATQTAPTDAREASMSRVQTQDTILSKFASQGDATDPAKAETEAEQGKGEGESKGKKPYQERIQELVNKRREAEAKATEAERRAQEAEERLNAALQATAKPIEGDARPLRSQFATEDDYTDAVAEWKAKRVLAQREVEQAQARMEAEQAAIAQQWSKRQEQAMKELSDYADVIGKSEVNMPLHVHQFILESEQGPQVAYFLALHPDEAGRIAKMKPMQAVKALTAIEGELADIGDDKPKAKDQPETRKSKAPAPIEPVRSSPSAASSGNSFEEYKRRRQAGKS